VSRTASTTSSLPPGWSLDDLQHIVLDGVTWEGYEHLLKLVGNRPIRLTYDNGDLEIMSPLPEHERPKKIIGSMIGALIEELDLPHDALGSTTFRRRMKKKGLEPDDCFYIKSQPLIGGKKRINLPKDPPPDLAVEIDVTHRSIPRLPIYAALGVPEIWRYDGKSLMCLVLRNDGYISSEHSLAFPELRVADLRQFIRIAEETGDQTASLKAFRAWLRKQSGVR
jgi:Uma2 family endonuclease